MPLRKPLFVPWHDVVAVHWSSPRHHHRRSRPILSRVDPVGGP
ncbi:hypothetical protein [Actinacidiphila acidipaludis]|nr:hypothetical protein [Streptomyces acidipaludis]